MLRIYLYQFLMLFNIFTVFTLPVFSQGQQDLVKGNLIQFNDNGAWCWYQDERAVIDTAGKNLIIGSVASNNGTGGNNREGDVEAVIFNLKSGLSERFILKQGNYIFYADDHNAPAFLVRPDGTYLAMFAAHFNDTTSHYRIYNAGVWGSEQIFDWNLERPGGSNFQTTYSNVYYLSSENRTYNFVRGNNKSPNSMYSVDMGDTWSYGGQLTRNAGIGYNNGYYKYWGNGINRIDFVFTEYHPRDYNTSLYHGYIQNGQSHTSDGILVDDNILDTLNIPTPADFSQIFATNTVVQGMTMSRCWNIDVQCYDNGTIATIFKARINDTNPPSNDPDHAFLYARYDGFEWTTTYLCLAGKKLYYSEQDYTGLATLHPNDPNTIYISTPFDPRNDSNLGVHEIFKGFTTDDGASWTWTPITENSVRDNLRPIIPAWDNHNTALLWWRGTYLSAQNYDAAIVGLIGRKSEAVDLMNYVDATYSNTYFADGSPLVTTGPDPNQGPADNQWHERTGYGNGGSVFTSAEISGENAPVLKTRLIFTEAGTYDLWVNFWANPTADWRIKAGLTADKMQIFRQMASKQVEDGDHYTSLVLSGGGNTFLYQAYLGRIETMDNVDTLEVFVDDEAIETGSVGTLIGNIARTWYDGLSYARVNSGNTGIATNNTVLPVKFKLSQNYPNPFNPVTTISYSLTGKIDINLEIYNILGEKVRTLVNSVQNSGDYSMVWDATDDHHNPVSSGIYLYRLTGGNVALQRKMILVR
jgi:hypothetical protein